jgi:hypothetical protein
VFFVFSAERGVVGKPLLFSFFEGEPKGAPGLRPLLMGDLDFKLEFIV